LTKLNASTGVAGDDGIPHCAGSPHSSIDIGGEHEPLAHQIARSPLHAIQVVLFARVALAIESRGSPDFFLSSEVLANGSKEPTRPARYSRLRS